MRKKRGELGKGRERIRKRSSKIEIGREEE